MAWIPVRGPTFVRCNVFLASSPMFCGRTGAKTRSSIQETDDCVAFCGGPLPWFLLDAADFFFFAFLMLCALNLRGWLVVGVTDLPTYPPTNSRDELI
jgi:hypothetical protein